MKKVHIKSAIPIYIAAAVWVIFGIVRPTALLMLSTLLIAAAVSIFLYLIAGKVFPGRTIEVREKIKTGDSALDAEIEKGLLRLENLRKANFAIEHPGISCELDRMVNAGDQIFGELERDKRKYSLVRRFMNYYLPTSEKLMDQYQVLMNAQVKGENVLSSMNRIENSLGMIAGAFERCLDKLYADQELDIDAEIEVMRKMLESDGLFGSTPGFAVSDSEADDVNHVKLTLNS